MIKIFVNIMLSYLIARCLSECSCKIDMRDKKKCVVVTTFEIFVVVVIYSRLNMNANHFTCQNNETSRHRISSSIFFFAFFLIDTKEKACLVVTGSQYILHNCHESYFCDQRMEGRETH